MASFFSVAKKWKNKKTGNPQIGEAADKIITKATKKQHQERRKQSVSSRSSPWEPGFELKPRNIPEEISDRTVRDMGYFKHTPEGRRMSDDQRRYEVRRKRGDLQSADKIELDELLKKNKIRRSSQEKAETTRKSRSIASKLAAGIKAHKNAKKRQQEQSMEEIIQNVYNTKVTEGGPGKSKIPELTPEMRERFKQEHLESLKEIEKSKQKRKKERKEKEEREEIIRKWEKKQNEKKKKKEARRSKVVSDFEATKKKLAATRRRKEELAATRRIEEEDEKLKEARKLHPFASKSNLADMTPEQMSEIAHRGKIRSPPPGNKTDRMIKTAENNNKNRKKLKGWKKTKKAGKKKRGRKTRKKRRRRTKKKRRRRTKKKKNKKRRRTKKRRRK